MSSDAVSRVRGRSGGRAAAVGVVAAVLWLAVLAPPGVAAPAPTSAAGADCPWVGSSAPVAQRVDAVLGRMTVSQKLGMLSGDPSASPGYAGYIRGIPSLCVPALKLEDNGSGVGDGIGDITVFPDGEAAAATWDTPLVRQYGAAVGEEQRAKGTNVVLGPMINIMRDPRWGRTYETFSEDPYLTSSMGVAEIDGIQSQGVIAEAKHIGAYQQEYARTQLNSVVSRRALEEDYQAPFQAAVQQGHVGAIMAAADYTDGVYDNADPLLLSQDAKTDWGFNGFFTSDWDGANSLGSMEAGLDVTMPSAGYYGAPLQAAVQSGQIPMAYVNDHVSRILTEMFTAGLFEHPDTGDLSTPARTSAHVALAQQVSTESTVLMKNSDSQLPLNAAALTSVAVIGEAGSSQPKSVGCGSGAVSPTDVVTPLQGIEARVGSAVSVGYADGSGPTAAANLAASSSVAVVFADDEECEQGGASYDDRTSLDLGGSQDQLIAAVAAANPRTIVVLDTGSPVVMPWLSSVPAVLEAWYPGQTDGSAIASVLFGDSDPSGHLPETWPAGEAQMPTSSTSAWGNATADQFSEGLDVGYKWYQANDVTPLFPFGYGLSYTSFSYRDEHVRQTGGPDDPSFRVTATVTNAGSRAGSDVAQLYLGDPASTGEPAEQLEGYDRVTLNPGQSAKVSFTVDSSNMRYWDDSTQNWAVAPGTYKFLVGDSSANTSQSASAGLSTALGATQATLTAPQAMRPDQPSTVRSTVTVGGNQTQGQVKVALTLPAGWTAHPTSRAVFTDVRPGTSLTTSWQVTAPASDSARLAQLGVSATLIAGHSHGTVTGAQQTQVTDLVTGQLSNQSVTVTADYAGSSTLTLTNTSGGPVRTTWSATVPSGVTVTPATGTASLAPGAGRTIPITVTATGMNPGAQTVDFGLDSKAGNTTVHADTTLTVNVAYQSLTQAFNNVGVSDDSTPAAGNFDGSGNSFSVEALAAAGIVSRQPVSYHGVSFTWPDTTAGAADNMQVAGQTITMQGSGSHLSFLLSGTHGTATGTGVITYTDGSTASFTLNSDNWTVAAAGAGTGSVAGTDGDDLVAISAHWNPAGSPDGDYQVAVFGYRVPLDTTKTVAYVTMPTTMGGGDGSGLQTTHIFGLAIAP